MEQLIEEPTRPGDNECCGGGCSPCVWDHYYDELKRWKEQQKQQSSGADES